MAEALHAAVREAARARGIPKDALCGECGFPDPITLEPWGDKYRCYRCANLARGRAPEEAHHILSRTINATTVTMDANLHRILSELQREIPPEVRSAAPHDPLASTITLLCTVRDFGIAVVQFLGAAIAWLLRLWETLRERYGEDWQKQLGLPPLFPVPTT